MPLLLAAVKDRSVGKQIAGIVKESYANLRIVQAINYNQYREKVAADKPEILVLSKELFKDQEKDFFNTLEVLQCTYPTCKVLVIGRNDDSSTLVRKAFTKGIVDYLFLPLEKEKLWEALDLIMSKKPESKGQIGSICWDNQPEWVQPSLKSSFVYDFIFGNLTNAKEIYEKSKALGMCRTPNVVLVVNIDNFSGMTANKSELLKHNMRQEVYHVVQDALRETSEAMVAIVGPDSMAIVLTLEESEQDVSTNNIKSVSLDLADSIRLLVQEKTNMTVSVGIGSYLQDGRRLHLSYREACLALNHKFFIGGNRVIHIDEVEPFSGNLMNIEVGYDLVTAIKLGDKAGSRNCLNEIISKCFSDKRADPESLRIQAFEFLVLLVGAAREAGVDKKKLLAIEFQLGMELRRQEVAKDLQKWMYKVIDVLAEFVLEHHNQHNLKAVREAVQFIESKYFQELSLDEIARNVYLSPNYFSSIFRKETGYTVSDYITKIRIEKAKELLKNLENSVSDVGLKVGYHDPRYFCRVFKAVVGIPPSKYKFQ